MATQLRRDYQSRLNLDGTEYEVLSTGHRTAKAALREGRRIIREIATTQADQKGMLEKLSAVSVPDLSFFPIPPSADQADENKAWWAEVAGLLHPASLAAPTT